MKNRIYLIAFAMVAMLGMSVTFADDAEIIGNKSSVVTNDAVITDHYVVQVLKKYVENGNYVRIASVKLDYMPVLIAITKTSMKNTDFVNVLKNNGNVRIGKKIMELSPTITYNNSNSTIKVSSIDNQLVRQYLSKVGYSANKSVVVRSITFTKGNATMNMVEYILPNDLD